MSDPPGVQASLGIEAVEWSADGENLIVRITGRWRRRRPAYGGQPTLVVESQGSRHRFPATPEPPGLTGTAPGIWRIGFTVPAALAPDLATRSWLLFGGVVVRLPEAVEAAQADAGPVLEELATGAGATTEAPAAPRPVDAVAPTGDPARRAQSDRPADRAQAERTVAPSAAPNVRRVEHAASELVGRIDEFERMLTQARVESRRLIRRLAEGARERRAVEQLAHAERLRRLEVEEELAARERDVERSRLTLAELATTEDRVRELEREMAGLRRQADEAEQVAAAACAARGRTERREAERTLAERRQKERALADQQLAQRRGLSRERELVALRADAASRSRVTAEPTGSAIPEEPPESAGATSAAPAPEADPAPAAQPLEPVVEALTAEIELRAASEARLRARLGVAEGRFETRVDAEGELAATLAQLRAEFASLHSDLEYERANRVAAERRARELEHALGEQRARTARANTAIEELREALEGLRAAVPAAPPPESRAAIEPERFSDALVRLRETIAPAEGAEPGPEGAEPPEAPADGLEPPAAPADDAETGPSPDDAEADHVPDEAALEPQTPRVQFVGRPWLGRVFTALARKDAARAGRLLLDLLPAQAASYHGSVAYDLVLGRDVGTVAVTLRDGQLKVATRSSPREPGVVDFQAVGSPGRLARLLTAGWVRRRTKLGLARVRGDRQHVSALESLIDSPLSLAELHDAGVRLDPLMALTMVSLMIERRWTRGEKFTLALEEAGVARAFLKVRRRSRPVVLEAESPDRVSITVVAEADSLLAVLAGRPDAAIEVRGDERALSTLLEWINRAQCG
jgi:hypothetical protein